MFKDEKIYNVLPYDAIVKRRDLKFFISQLAQTNQSYCWVGPAKLQIYHNGTRLHVTNMKSGFILLNVHGLTIPTETLRKNTKRKLDLIVTPLRGTKISIHNIT